MISGATSRMPMAATLKLKMRRSTSDALGMSNARLRRRGSSAAVAVTGAPRVRLRLDNAGDVPGAVCLERSGNGLFVVAVQQRPVEEGLHVGTSHVVPCGRADVIAQLPGVNTFRSNPCLSMSRYNVVRSTPAARAARLIFPPACASSFVR